MSADDAPWQGRRRLVRHEPDAINLNSGTLFPTPIPVQFATDVLRGKMTTAPSDFLWRVAPALIEKSRAALARYVNCPASDLLLLPNATFGVNLVASSLRLEPGDEVLTTDHEYGAMMYCWRHHARERGFVVREIQLPFRAEDQQDIVNAFERQITSRTRVIYFSHVTTTTGLVLPARELCAMARERAIITVIDGAHGPGMVPVDLEATGADYYTANCHKWLMCAAGAGFLHVRPEHKSSLRPLVVSWGYGYEQSKLNEPHPDGGGTHWQRDMEFHGTTDRCAQMTIADAIAFREELGGETSIAQRVRELNDCARTRIGALGLLCATPMNPALRGALVAFTLPDAAVEHLSRRLWEQHRIEAPTTRAVGSGFLRVSTAWFNTSDEIDRLADAAGRILQELQAHPTRGSTSSSG